MLKPGEALSMRGRQQDRLAVAMLVDHKHMQFVVDGGFDGVYTYFAAEGFSTFRNWAAISIIIHSPTKPPLIPSFGLFRYDRGTVGPGFYIFPVD